MVDAGEHRERPEAVAGGAANLVRWQAAVGAVQVELLDGNPGVNRRLERIGQARRDVDDGADRIARISRENGP